MFLILETIKILPILRQIHYLAKNIKVNVFSPMNMDINLKTFSNFKTNVIL